MAKVKILLSALLALALLTACSGEQETVRVLTYATPYPPGHPFSRADKKWMEYIVRESGGRITFRPYWAGSLISSEMSMLEIRHGLADIGLITPIYTRGGAHLLQTQAGFYGGVESIEEQVAVFNCVVNLYPQFGRELEGLKVLAVQGGNFPGILTRNKPVQSLEDLKGLRLRVQTEAAEVLRRLGADPVTMPMGEVYSALAKGIIDGVVAPADTLHSLHFSEVASHFTTVRFSRGAYPARAMSAQSWRALPVDLQQLVLQAHEVWESALSSELKAAEARGISYGKEHGISFYAFPTGEQARLDALYNDVARDKARALRDIGIDGELVFLKIQALIAAGSPIECKAYETL